MLFWFSTFFEIMNSFWMYALNFLLSYFVSQLWNFLQLLISLFSAFTKISSVELWFLKTFFNRQLLNVIQLSGNRQIILFDLTLIKVVDYSSDHSNKEMLVIFATYHDKFIDLFWCSIKLLSKAEMTKSTLE